MWIPTSDRVLLRFDVVEERVTAAGIVLPGLDVDERYKAAGVVAVGRNVCEVKVGDRVLISSYAGSSMPDDELMRLVCESDVMAVIR